MTHLPSHISPTMSSLGMSSYTHVQANLSGALASSMAKFRKRCHDVDPVTGQGRYGEQMRKKVYYMIRDKVECNMQDRSTARAEALHVSRCTSSGVGSIESL